MRAVQATRGTALNRALVLIASGLWLLGLSVDQLTKLAALAYLEPGVPGAWVLGVLRLQLIFNPGAAFGMGESATVVFSLFAIAATAVCIFVGLPRIARGWHALTLGLLLAGITGNLVDRIVRPPSTLHGHVVDFIQLRGFAIFNVADICITAAAALLIVMSFMGEERRAEKAGEAEGNRA